jgi:hypothetical protein
MIGSLWIGRRGAPSEVRFDHVGDDGARLGEIEGGDGRIHLAWISTDRESPNAGIGYLILLTQEFGSDPY